MSSWTGTLLGAATFWPIIYVLLFTILVPGVASTRNPHDKVWLVILGAMHVLSIVLSIGLLVYFLKRVWRAARFSTGARVLWTLLLIALNPVAMPILFFVLRQRESSWQANRP